MGEGEGEGSNNNNNKRDKGDGEGRGDGRGERRPPCVYVYSDKQTTNNVVLLEAEDFSK